MDERFSIAFHGGGGSTPKERRGISPPCEGSDRA
jgi:hypothetical protein